MTFSVGVVVGEEGRVAAGHRRDHRGHGRRRHRGAPRLGRACPGRSAGWVDASVINAGDGWHEHPTQALLDCYTIRQPRRLEGLHIAIVGDIKHSRVARSDVLAFTALGAEVTLVAPPTPAPAELEGWPVEVSHDLDAVLPKVDVVYLLRMQLERQTEALVPSLREYTALRAHPERAPAAADDALVMHPGPMNRGVEIAPEVADLPNSVITRPGRQRRGGADGGALPAARLGRRSAERHGRWSVRRRHPRAATVVDATGVAGPTCSSTDGRIVAVGTLDLDGDDVLDAAGASSRPASSTSTPTCASPAGRRPRRSRPARGPRPSAASPRSSSPCPTPSPPSTAPPWSARCSSWAGTRCATCTSPAPSPSGGPGERLAPMAEMAASASGSSPTTATGVQDARLMRRALEYAAGLGVTLAQHCEDEALAAGGHMHEGEWSSRLGIPASRPRPRS